MFVCLFLLHITFCYLQYRNTRNETQVETNYIQAEKMVIVQHNVSYIWNDMEPSDRGLSATEIYDQTIGLGVIEGKIGNITVAEECNQCEEPDGKIITIIFIFHHFVQNL